MSWLESLILGIIQGLTEFLPVSSSGHIELGKAYFQLNESGVLFSIIVHAATTLSTIVVFHRDIFSILRKSLTLKWSPSLRFVSFIAISMLPLLVLAPFKDRLEQLFDGNIELVGYMLLFTCALLTFAHFKKDQNKELNYLSAFIIGIAQAIAVLPGISRSGATIGTSLLLGIRSDEAARFSFLMVIVPILGITLLECKGLIEEPSEATLSLTATLVGFFTAFITGLIACKIMIAVVKRKSLLIFAIYCFLVGVGAILTATLQRKGII